MVICMGELIANVVGVDVLGDPQYIEEVSRNIGAGQTA